MHLSSQLFLTSPQPNKHSAEWLIAEPLLTLHPPLPISTIPIIFFSMMLQVIPLQIASLNNTIKQTVFMILQLFVGIFSPKGCSRTIFAWLLLLRIRCKQVTPFINILLNTCTYSRRTDRNYIMRINKD